MDRIELFPRRCFSDGNVHKIRSVSHVAVCGRVGIRLLDHWNRTRTVNPERQVIVSRFLIVLFVASMFAATIPAPAEAGPLARIAARARRPFGGNGVPVLRRIRNAGACNN